MSDIDTVVVDRLTALDPEWPIREADIAGGPDSTYPETLILKAALMAAAGLIERGGFDRRTTAVV